MMRRKKHTTLGFDLFGLPSQNIEDMTTKIGVEERRINTQLSAKGFCKRSIFELNIKKINFCTKVIEIIFWSWAEYSGGYLVSGEFHF